MNVYIECFADGQPVSMDAFKVYEHCMRENINTMLVNTLDLITLKVDADNLFVGGLDSTRKVFRNSGIVSPLYFNIPNKIQNLVDRTYKEYYLSSVLDIDDVVSEWSGLTLNDKDVFVKELAYESSLGQTRIKKEALKSFIVTNKITRFALASPVTFFNEYRVFVKHGNIINISRVIPSTISDLFPGENNIDRVRALKAKLLMVTSAIGKSLAAYTIDVGLLADGARSRFDIIELNDAWAIGSYDLPQKEYYEFLVARWQQLFK